MSYLLNISKHYEKGTLLVLTIVSNYIV